MYNSCLFRILLIVGIPVALLAAYFGLNYSGFCFAQMRYLSDEEKIRSIFNYQNERKELSVETATQGTQYHNHIKYKSFDEYIEQNPNCCQINPGEPYSVPPTYHLDRIFGYDSGDVVVIDFKVCYLDKKGKQQFKIIHFENVVRNCGNPLG